MGLVFKPEREKEERDMKITHCSKRPILSQCQLKNFEYQIDTYIGCGHYCYYCYVLPQAETDWSQEIRIHNDIVGQLSKELEKIPPQTIYFGYHTDPYQPCEEEHLQTKKVLELLVKNGFSASILTKSDLVVRDLEIFQEMDNAAISVSVAFNDNQTRRLFEANTVDTERRIEALRKLKEAGVKTGALLCPVIPYVTDAISLIDKLEPYADVIWVYGLTINDRSDQNWLNISNIFRDQHHDLLQKIDPVLFSKDHSYWKELRDSLTMLKNNRQLNMNIHL